MKKPRRRHPLLDLGGFVLDRTKAARIFRQSSEDLEILLHELPLSGLYEPIRLVHLTDFHASRSVRFPFLEKALADAIALKPDLFCLTGDYTTCGLKDWDPLSNTLRRLSDFAPCYAVLGNHDGGTSHDTGLYEQTLTCLHKAHIQILENRHAVFAKGNSRLQIVGTGDLLVGPFKPDAAFADCEPETPTVLLTHNPDAREALLPYRWHLCLCGHTHGGQINLPGLNGLFTPIVNRRYQSGIFPEDDRYLHVNRGLGSIGGVRFRARPEICVFELSGLKDPKTT